MESGVPAQTMTLLFYAMGGQSLMTDRTIVDDYHASNVFETWYNAHPQYKNMDLVTLYTSRHNISIL